MGDRLGINQQLWINDKLTSLNGKTELVMQGDGNLVLYRTDNGKPLWASNTDGSGVVRAIFQADGNFVCYDNQNQAHWASGTDGQGGTHVVLQYERWYAGLYRRDVSSRRSAEHINGEIPELLQRSRDSAMTG